MVRTLLAGLLVCVCSAGAAADDLFDRSELRPLEVRPIEPLAGFDVREPETASGASAGPAAFGEKGSRWWTFGVGVADNFSDATDYNVRVAWSQFLVQGIEFSVEANGWYSDQPGDDAIGINPAFVFRWHFYEVERWTLFADVGIGLLFTTDDAPPGGTSFNFTPRIGIGTTYRLDDDGTRLQLGLRWHHISNARLSGDSENPARDGALLYAGVMIPF